jgi:peptidoglycan/xylan/chitin deacetylase (PgdA/CDA1 family)
VKRTLKYLLALYLFYSGALRKEIDRLQKQTCIIGIYAHELSSKEFEKYIRWLIKQGFAFVSLQEVINFIEGKYKPEGCKIWLSFDDGWSSNLKLISVIEKYNIPLTIFIPTYPVEMGFDRDTLENELTEHLPGKYKENIKLLMEIPEEERWTIDQELYRQAEGKQKRVIISVDELKKLAQHPLVSIGAHTHTHPLLSKCHTEKIKEEVRQNLIKLKEYVNVTPKLLALPNGNYNDRVLDTILQTDIKYIASIESGKILKADKELPLPRNGIATASFYENCCRMLDFWYPNVAKLNSFIKF